MPWQRRYTPQPPALARSGRPTPRVDGGGQRLAGPPVEEEVNALPVGQPHLGGRYVDGDVMHFVQIDNRPVKEGRPREPLAGEKSRSVRMSNSWPDPGKLTKPSGVTRHSAHPKSSSIISSGVKSTVVVQSSQPTRFTGNG